MNSISFEIPFRLPSLNEYVDTCRTNRYQGARGKKDTEHAIMWVLPKCKIDCQVLFEFIWYEQKKNRDKDNVAFAKKYILDAMQKSGMLPNDNNKYVMGFQDSFVYGEGDKVKVIVKMGENK